MTYASTLRLWCLLEQYDHGIRFTCTRTRVEKSKMKIWNWIWPVNGLCDLDYSFNLSVMLLSMRVAAIYCGYSSTFRPIIFFRTSKKGAIRMQMGHVEFSWHSFFLCAPSPLVFSLCASGPTVGLPTAFWCIRCHSFYLSVTLLTDECGPFLLLSVVYRISFASHCGYIGVEPN